MEGYKYQEDRIELAPDRISEGKDPILGPMTIFHDVIIASEIVQPYEDGMAFKCREELEDYTWTVEGRWGKAGSHPDDAIISDKSDVNGRTVNAHFVKNLKDPKTGRPNRAGVKADIQVFNKRIAPDLLEAMKNGTKRDVSIGFFYQADKTPGKVLDGPFKDEAYDYVQRNMFHDHLAFAIDNGRCPSPYCGLGADEVISKKLTNDPFAGFKNWNECVRKVKEGNPDMTEESALKICGKLKSEHEDAKELERIKNIKALLTLIAKECDSDDVNLIQKGELKLNDMNLDKFLTEYTIQASTKQIDDKIKELLKDL